MTDEQARLLEALEPFRIEAAKAGYQDGIQQGILRVFTGLLHWAVEEPRDDDSERERRILASQEVRRWMEDSYPVIRETFPRKSE